MIREQVAQSKSAFLGNRPSSFCFCLKSSSAQALFSSDTTCIPPFGFFAAHHTKRCSRSPRLRTIPAAPFQSKCGKPKDTAGSLADGLRQTQEWTVAPDSYRIATLCIFCDMDLNARVCSRKGNHKAQGGYALATGNRKNGCSAQKGAAADFPQQKPPHPVLAGVAKVTSHEQFSWLTLQRFNQAFSGFPNDRLSSHG